MESNATATSRRECFLQDYSKQAFGLLEEFRVNSELCDVVLCIDKKQIPAHRAVLAASSPYFRAMFSGKMMESFQKEVFLFDLDASAVEELVGFFYSGKIVIDENNVQSILYAACLLAVSSVKQYCCDFLEQEMCVNNCLGIRALADRLSCRELFQIADSYTATNFSQVVNCEEFLIQPYESIVTLAERDYLGITGEAELLNGVIKWLHWDHANRAQHAYNLLKRLHLMRIDGCHLRSLLDDTVFSKDHRCIDLILEQLEALGSGSVVSAYEFPMFMHRQYGSAKEVLLAIGGESAGVLLDSVECMDFDSLKWNWTISDEDLTVTMPPMLQCHNNAAASSTGRHVYVIGGNSPWKALSVVQKYQWPDNSWQRIAALNQHRLAAGAAIVDGQLLTIGGWGQNGYLSSVETYDPLIDQWTNVQPMKSRRSYLGVAQLNGYIYAVGGYGGCEDDSFLSTVECYIPSSDIWITAPPLLQARAYFGLVAERG